MAFHLHIEEQRRVRAAERRRSEFYVLAGIAVVGGCAAAFLIAFGLPLLRALR